MRISTLSTTLLLAFSLTSVGIVGCGNSEKTDVAADTEESAANTMADESSTENAGASDLTEEGEKLKAVMIDMSQTMLSIANDVKTVEEAEAAEGKLAAMIDQFISSAKNLKITPELLPLIEKDPEVTEWSEKVQARITRMKEETPEVAAKFEEISRGQIMRMMEAWGEIMSQGMPAVPQSEGSGQ